MFPQMYKIASDIKLKAVQYYLHNGATLKSTAARFNIHYLSLFKWTKQYQKSGAKRLLQTYSRPWNRFHKKTEETIMQLKEDDPRLTIRKTREMLAQQGIRVSIKGIWNVWKRYGYTGFKKESLCPDFTEYCPWTCEARQKFNQAQLIFQHGDEKTAAEILNTIPSLPRNELIGKIPDRLLNIRRRVEKIALLYRTTPIRSYLTTLGDLYAECKHENLHYSALRVKLFEIGARSFAGEPSKQLQNSIAMRNALKRRDKHLSSLLFSLQFPALLSEGIARAQLSQITKAAEISRSCYRLIKQRKHISRSFIYELGSLCTWIEDYKKAEYCYLRALPGTRDDEKQARRRNLGFIFFNKGDYKKALTYLKSVREKGWGYDPKVLMCEAMWYLVQGMPEKAISLTTKALSLSKKEELNIGILTASARIASAYCGLGKRTQAITILQRLLPFAQKHFTRMAAVFEDIICSHNKQEHDTLRAGDIFPTARLNRYLKKGQYARAYSYAQEKYLIAHLHQYILFYPEVVLKQIENGKSVHIPHSILRLPVFNNEIPVYHIKFLGPLKISKNNRYLKTKLPPRDSAFLIHFAEKAGEPGRSVALKDLFSNFWKESRNPSRNLSHLLVRIKKALRIPPHLLAIIQRQDGPALSNYGIHFMSDHDELHQILVTAHALERTGEWELSCQEYIRAFKQFRAPPFIKMYDAWSESARRAILNTYEKNAVSFARSCINHGDIKNAKRVLKKLNTIIPQSQTIAGMLHATP